MILIVGSDAPGEIEKPSDCEHLDTDEVEILHRYSTTRLIVCLECDRILVGDVAEQSRMTDRIYRAGLSPREVL